MSLIMFIYCIINVIEHIQMEDITDEYYANAKRVCKDFEIINLGEYHDL